MKFLRVIKSKTRRDRVRNTEMGESIEYMSEGWRK